MGKGLALRVVCGDPNSEVRVWQKLLDVVLTDNGFLTCLDYGLGMSSGVSLHVERLAQNWSRHGESDRLIKTKHCDFTLTQV